MSNSSGLMSLAQNTNSLLGGYFFGWSVLIMLGVVTFSILKIKNYTNASSFAVTCWFCMMTTWFLRAMTLIDNYTLWGSVILAIGSVFILFISDN